MLDRLTIEQMAAKAGGSPILIALSGGGDSVGLMHVLCDAFDPERLRAAIVDHALREGSAADAETAAAFAEHLGIASSVLRLSWNAGENRGHESLREARYRALCAEAHRVDAHIIAAGHTRDDQAETVLIRAARGSGWRGLAGMRALAPVPLWPEGRNLTLARPLLRHRREALRVTLRERGARWLEDPSNANADYARVRARNRLAALAATGEIDPMRLAELAEQLTPRVQTLAAAAHALITTAVKFDGDTIQLTRADWNATEAVRHRALSTLLTAAGGEQREPPHEQVAALDARLCAPNFTAATLAGAWLLAQREHILIRRDPGALNGRADGARCLPPLPLVANIDAVWDGRVALRVSGRGWSVVVEEGRPRLARGEERSPLESANPRWLLAGRARHLLDPTSDRRYRET